jgi:hypothetical protein
MRDDGSSQIQLLEIVFDPADDKREDLGDISILLHCGNTGEVSLGKRMMVLVFEIVIR